MSSRIPRSNGGVSSLALEGVRVLDLTRGWSGPIGARMLADLGAEVILVETLTVRGYFVTQAAPDPQEYVKVCHSAYPDNDPGAEPYNRYGHYNEYQRNKLSLTLDLTREDCKEVFRSLVAISDVVMENYSPRVMRNFGLDYSALRKINPSIVFVSMPGFGMTGPHRDHVSYGTNIEPTAGFSNLIGYPDSKPYKSGEAYPDPNAGLHAVAAVLTALFYRRRTGKGQHIDLSQNEATVGLIGESLL
ncbi:MAG: CoA transferase, partial [Dehalococcoidia bacterium]